ncbi:hypothetical protein [Jatrophihabitans sp. GAS493]|nr:hypothetical protein [Jatrophihabitans sp. GAS493]
MALGPDVSLGACVVGRADGEDEGNGATGVGMASRISRSEAGVPTK